MQSAKLQLKMQNHQTRLLYKQQLTNDVFLFRFQLIEPLVLTFKAGQYMILLVSQMGKEPLRRLYSIASSEKQVDSFEMIIKLVEGGNGSDYLKKLQIGDEANFQGPAGQFGLKVNQNNKVFLATGTGIAPMMSMIEAVISRQLTVSTVLLWGVATAKDVFFLDRLKQLKEDNFNFDFKVCLSREKDLSTIDTNDRQFFHLGHINSLIIPNPYLLTTDYYICGRREMVEGLRMELEGLGVGKERVCFERF